jgi:hypothetical protein
MSIPVNLGGARLSTTLIAGHYLYPDNLQTYILLDYELGGIGLNDPSAGLRYQKWTLRYFPNTEDMVIEADNTSPTILFNRPDITEISLAFDQNMNPFVAFVQDGDAWFWWWDTDVQATVFTPLPANTITPRCCLDDKRESQTDTSDIILCYVTNNVLYSRQERDRYTEQYTLDDPFLDPTYGLPAVLVKVGMNEFNRLQWTCDFANPDRGPCD